MKLYNVAYFYLLCITFFFHLSYANDSNSLGLETGPFSEQKLLTAEQLFDGTNELIKIIDSELDDVNSQLNLIEEKLSKNPSKKEQELIQNDLMESIAGASAVLNRIDKVLLKNREVKEHEILNDLLLDIKSSKSQFQNNYDDDKLAGFIRREEQINKWKNDHEEQYTKLRQDLARHRKQIEAYREKLELWLPIIWRQKMVRKIDELLKDLKKLRNEIKAGDIV